MRPLGSVALFLVLSWVGLKLTHPPSQKLEEHRRAMNTAREEIPPAAPVPSTAAPVTKAESAPSSTEGDADSVQRAHAIECREGAQRLGLGALQRHCGNSGVSERIRDAAMTCSPHRAPEDLGPRSACESATKTMLVFLSMLPAYEDPRLIGTPGYPAELFFQGITEYLQMVRPEEYEQVLESGLEALHQASEPGQNGNSWAQYWQEFHPELASRHFLFRTPSRSGVIEFN